MFVVYRGRAKRKSTMHHIEKEELATAVKKLFESKETGYEGNGNGNVTVRGVRYSIPYDVSGGVIEIKDIILSI